MELTIYVVPNAKKAGIKQDQGKLKIYLRSIAKDNRANKELVRILAKALGCPKSSILIARGEKSRQKTLSIFGENRSNQEIEQLLLANAGM